MRLLNIVSSPRGAQSASITVANAFLDAYLKTSDSIGVKKRIYENRAVSTKSWELQYIYARAFSGTSIVVSVLK